MDSALCCLVHCMLSAYGSRYGSAGFSQISAQLFDTEYKRKVPKPLWFRNFFGCGGRTRTYDLRVMSPTSFQLLYSAIFRHSLECLGIIAHGYCFVKTFLCELFPNKISIPIFIFSIHSRKDIAAGGLPPAADCQLFCNCCLLYWSVYKL